MALNTSNYFDLYNILVNEIVGDLTLFIILALLAILLYAIRYKIPGEVTLLMSVLLLGIIFAKTFMILIWVFIVLIVGFMFYWALSKYFK